jgi:hypothetical protein
LKALITVVERLVTVLTTTTSVIAVAAIIAIITITASLAVTASITITSATTIAAISIAILPIEIWLTYIIFLFILKLSALLTSWAGGRLESWDDCERIAQEKPNDLASLIIGENFLNELVEARVACRGLLDSLVTKERKLAREQLLRRWWLSLNELTLAQLLEEVEVRDIHRGNKTDYLLGLRLAFSDESREVNLWVLRNRVVYDNVELFEWNAARRDISQNQRRDLLLLQLLNSLAELNLGHVANQLNRRHATLLQNHIREIRV